MWQPDSVPCEAMQCTSCVLVAPDRCRACIACTRFCAPIFTAELLLYVYGQCCMHCTGYEEKQRELEFDLRREEDHLKAAQEEQAQLKCGMCIFAPSTA